MQQRALLQAAAMNVIKTWFRNKIRYYVVFTKAIFFVLGLLFTYRLVEIAVFSILVTHITAEWKDPNLPKAVTIVNLQEGAYEILQILFAYIADACSGLFPMVIFSTILYIIGLMLSFIAARQEGFLHHGIFYTALVLITLSQSAEKVTLTSFLGDQILAKDEAIRVSRTKFWRNSLSLVAAIVAIFGTSKINSFKVLSLVSAMAMGVAFLWFLLGIKFYTHVEYPRWPHSSRLRSLDRAASVVQDQEKPGNTDKNIYKVEQVMEFWLKMLPLWTTFLTFSLVAATWSTFFLEEATNIDENFPILVFIVLENFTQFIVAEIADYVLEKLGKEKKQRLILVRIGIGMICCVLCCVAAWINAVHWLTLVKKQKWDERGLIDIFRMVPQYLLLGAMEGLSGDGLENFFDSQVSKSISRYGPPFGECVMGVGKFLSVVCVLILSKWFRWFKKDINKSRLDNYYALLAVVSMVNMVFYWLVAYWYGDDRVLEEDYNADDIEKAPEEGHGSTVSEQSQPLHEDKLSSLDLKIGIDQKASPSNSNDEEERMNYDIRSTDHISSGLANGPSDGSPLPSEIRSFPRTLSRRSSKRVNSKH